MCTFKTISKRDTKRSSSYIIATTILNQSKEFTLDKVLADVEKKISEVKPVGDVDVKHSVVTKLNMLRDNGVVVEHGSYFTLREQIC